MIIPARPFPRATTGHIQDNSGCLAGTAGLAFFPLGRQALLFGLLELGMRPGDAILFPAWFCESTLQPLRAAGFELVFVDVDETMQPPLSGVLAAIESRGVKATVFVNYFGRKNPSREALVETCARHRIRVIEDCAHSFQACDGSVYAAEGPDAVIYSMRKILPVADGGAIRFRSGRVPRRLGSNSRPSAVTDFLYEASRNIERAVVQCGWPNLYGRNIQRWKRRIRAMRGSGSKTPTNPATTPGSTGASALLQRYLVDREHLKSVARLRIANYQKLRGLIADSSAPVAFPTVSFELVPQVLPVIDVSHTLLDFLHKRGIGAFRWPGDDAPLEVQYRPDRYSNAIHLNNSLVCLPVHQDIGDHQISYIATAIAEWSANVGG